MSRAESQQVALISNDESLIDRAGDAAAAAGFTLVPCRDASVPPPGGADALLIGLDACPGLLREGVPRAADALIVGPDGRPDLLWQAAVEFGASGTVSLPSGSAWLVQWLHTRTTSARQRDTVVSVVVGSAGGVGASTLSAALAVTAASCGLHPLLMDAHPGHGGVDLLMGDPAVPDHWSRFAGIRGFLPPEALQALPVLEGARCLGWGGAREIPLWRGAVGSVLTAARRDHDLVVLDAGQHALVWEELPRRTRPILIVPASWRGVLAARPRLTSLTEAFEQSPLIVMRDVGGKIDPRSFSGDFPGCRVLHMGFDASVISDEEHCRPPGTRPRSEVSKLSRRVLAALARTPAAA